MDNFDIFAVIASATLVAKFVLLILCIMSVTSWTLIIYKFFSLRSARRKAIEGIERFTDARDLRDAVNYLAGDANSPVFHVAQQGVAEFNRLREAGNSEEVAADNVRRSLRQGVSEAMTKLNASLSFLATTANTAPFIGLFGTVWGIMHSFHQIGMKKTAAIATVAPGISEALIATALGLFVAIPATMGYNMFLSTLTAIEAELVNFAGVFLNRVQRELDVAKKPGNGSGAAPKVQR
ncbi:Protein TolQ [uncultured delta proteobacterium]|uniref:Protein TolQ n=1 Tax=uncultured delta proteobacterium TaxID=34034 RepID=A0A212KDK6_9DELT|nr:Protein TolQ [uncultured delta proteobacterium]